MNKVIDSIVWSNFYLNNFCSRFVLWWRSFFCRAATVIYLSLLRKNGLYGNISSRTCYFWACRNINRSGKKLQNWFLIVVEKYEKESSGKLVQHLSWSMNSFKCFFRCTYVWQTSKFFCVLRVSLDNKLAFLSW